MFSIFQRFSEYRTLFGPSGISLALRARFSSGPLEVETHPTGFPHPLWIRLKTSDLPTLQKVWRDREYAIRLKDEPSFIIDAGANIGIASIYFATKFPNARVIAIEPEEKNFALLERNTRPYANISPVKAALWNESGEVSLIDPGQGPWSFQTRGDTPNSTIRVKAITIPDIQQKFSVRQIDILKIDIEGAEKEIFENAAPWIDDVGVIMAETHDRFRAGCSRALYLAAQQFDHEEHRGETVILARKELVA
jgi:FkbM family methyltransferase